jgi:hypothetical protein
MSEGVEDSMHNPSLVKSLVAQPDAYDGDPKKYRNWRRQVQLYVRAHPKEVKDTWDTALILIST